MWVLRLNSAIDFGKVPVHVELRVRRELLLGLVLAYAFGDFYHATVACHYFTRHIRNQRVQPILHQQRSLPLLHLFYRNLK